MKTCILSLALTGGVKRIHLSLIVALALTGLHQNAIATPAVVTLGSDAGFAVLAGSGITITGPTKITGDIGTFPTTSITGFQNVTLNGANDAGNAVTQQAKSDLLTAYNDAVGRASGTTYAGGFDLVGQTLTSGVYHDATSLFLSGTLTLDAQGNPDAVWIFQAGSTLITASNSTIDLIGGAQACHVFWQVGSSATLGIGTDFAGNILALTSITLDTGATVDGRVLAQNGAVTLDTNTITLAVCSSDTTSDTGGSGGTGGGTGGTGGTGGGPATAPETGSTLLLLGAGLAALLACKRESFAVLMARAY